MHQNLFSWVSLEYIEVLVSAHYVVSPHMVSYGRCSTSQHSISIICLRHNHMLSSPRILVPPKVMYLSSLLVYTSDRMLSVIRNATLCNQCYRLRESLYKSQYPISSVVNDWTRRQHVHLFHASRVRRVPLSSLWLLARPLIASGSYVLVTTNGH